ncbi:hypothetical protein F5B17DRAFT_140227 [Nemania serpens]|nr:hypothetical protein F5B17DRAFT_140227 [Nemania serpens]
MFAVRAGIPLLPRLGVPSLYWACGRATRHTESLGEPIPGLEAYQAPRRVGIHCPSSSRPISGSPVELELDTMVIWRALSSPNEGNVPIRQSSGQNIIACGPGHGSIYLHPTEQQDK